MNRVLGDHFETLLYKIFVSIDENTTIQELGNLLQIDVQLVKVGEPNVLPTHILRSHLNFFFFFSFFFSFFFFIGCSIHLLSVGIRV